MKNNSVRLIWPDLIKAFAIFGVIGLHTINYYPDWISGYISKIFLTSVPLFVMVSGALLLGKKDSYLSFFKKRVLKVLVPWILWTLIYMSFLYFYKDEYILTNYLNQEILNIRSIFNFFIIQFLTGLWFLPLIFSLYIITPVLRIIVYNSSKLDSFYLLSIWFFSISVLPYLFSSSLFPNWLPSVIYAPIQFSGYFILGYLLTKNINLYNKIHYWFVIPIIAVIFLFPIKSFLDPFTVISSTMILVYLLFLSEKVRLLNKKKLNHSIYLVGGSSLGVYVIHSGVHYVIIKQDLLPPILNNFFFTIILFIFSLFIVLILRKVPVVRNIVP